MLPDIPALAELKRRPQWVAWARETRNGRTTKIPVNPLTGANASSDDPGTWGTYQQACRCAEKRHLDGVGYVLGKDDDLTGIDLDKCIGDDGQLEPWAAKVIKLSETYAERSPSRRGVRLFALGKVPKSIVYAPAQVEIYGTNRYLTVTGDHIEGTPTEIGPAPKTLAMLQERVAALKPAPKERPKSQSGGETFFGRVNSLALGNLGSWVPMIFGADAEPQGNGGFRVSSAALGRELQEALSLHPTGIKDWGVADMGDEREGKRSPIDIVIEYGADVVTNDGREPDAMTAARWLCEQLDVDPVELERPNAADEFSDVISDVAASLPGHWARMLFGLPAIPSPPTQPGEAPKEKIIRPTLFTWQDPATISPRQWLYDRHYIRQFVSATIAPGGVGKSSLAVVEALAMVTGKPLLGVMPRQVCRVWYWCGEDPLDEIKRRVAAACLRHDIAPEDIGDRLFLDSGRTSEIIMATAGRDGVTIAKPVADAILRAITDFRIDVMIVDPFVSSHQIGENDNTGMDMVVKQWKRIADRTSSAIELVHHSRKTGGSEVTIEDARGGGAFGNAVRSGRVINTMTNDEAGKARVDNRRLFFRVDNGKANLAPPSDHAVWRRLVSVPLGNGDDVGVVTSWKWPDAMEGVTQDDFGRVAEVIRGAQWRKHHSANNWVGYAVADALDLDTDDKHDRAKINGMVKSWLKTGALQVVEALDAGRKKRCFVVVPEHSSDFAPVN